MQSSTCHGTVKIIQPDTKLETPSLRWKVQYYSLEANGGLPSPLAKGTLHHAIFHLPWFCWNNPTRHKIGKFWKSGTAVLAIRIFSIQKFKFGWFLGAVQQTARDTGNPERPYTKHRELIWHLNGRLCWSRSLSSSAKTSGMSACQPRGMTEREPPQQLIQIWSSETREVDTSPGTSSFFSYPSKNNYQTSPLPGETASTFSRLSFGGFGFSPRKHSKVVIPFQISQQWTERKVVSKTNIIRAVTAKQQITTTKG